jgi:integrase/recombinase XerD
MRESHQRLSLFGQCGHRKYLNGAERRQFVQAVVCLPESVRLFCLTLLWTGARISEVLALTPAAIDIEGGAITIRTLKRRRPGVIRQVPVPPDLLGGLDRLLKTGIGAAGAADDGDTCGCDAGGGAGAGDLSRQPVWRFSRTTAWRYVKAVMTAAGIAGMAATPKGLRHAFGVNAFQSGVPPHLVQRWLGHASLRTTAIYGDVIGPEERAFAKRMWT